MSGYLHFIPEFVLCTNSSLFWFRIANELSEFRNYLLKYKITNLIPAGLQSDIENKTNADAEADQ